MTAKGLVLAVAALIVAIYGRGLAFPLTRDDIAHFGDRQRWERPLWRLSAHFGEEFWARGSRSGLYRPLTATTIQATEWFAGLEPFALKLGNAALLAATALAAAALARRLGASSGAATILALLIAAHPLLSETVLEVVSRSETQAALGVLLCAYCFAGPSRGLGSSVAAGAWFLFALLSKEGAFAATPALFVLAVVRPPASEPMARDLPPSQRGPFFPCLALVAALVIALAARAAVFGDLVGLDASEIARLDNPLVDQPFATRLVTGVALLGRYLSLLFWPAGLSADWSFAAITPLHGLGDVHFVVGAAALVAGSLWLAFAWRRGAAGRAELAGLLAAGSSWLLISSIARPVGTILAERLFCLPTIGLLVALVAALDRRLAAPAPRRLAAGVALVAVAALAARGFVRVGDWQSGLTLYTAASRVAPDSARVQCTLGHITREHGDLASAKPCLERALNILPDYGKAHAEMAALLGTTGATGGALVHLWLAARAPGATKQDELAFQAASRRFAADPRVRAEFKRYGQALVARRPDVELHRELGRELLKMGE